ncbi:MAG: hypothetical protein CO156_03460 [Candidatus Pacebacteria bacterium CG_4_9_14_3_um_filter_40_12]|nr:MAG: hypothetical protein CO156_03460 [Candidatus Pacebacteria bacterium CG_4_9_14_3_um_filter_40_12]
MALPGVKSDLGGLAVGSAALAKVKTLSEGVESLKQDQPVLHPGPAKLPWKQISILLVVLP